MPRLDHIVDRLYGAWAAAEASRQPPPVEAPPARQPISDERFDRLVGYAVAQLLRYGHEWVWRRTETFEFTSASTARRQMGVDFSLPNRVRPGVAMEVHRVQEMVDECVERGVPILVPLLTLEKKPLTDVDVFDEDGRTLPLLTTEQNGYVAGKALLSLALGVAQTREMSVFKETAAALASVARLPPTEAELLLDCLRDGPEPHKDALAQYGPPAEGADERRADAQQLHERITELLEREGAFENTAALLADDLLGALAQKFASDFIVLVPLTGDAYTRRVFKFAYEQPLSKERPDPSLPKREMRAERRRRTRAKMAERCSWRPIRITFDRIPVGTAQSHHVELVAPQDTDIVRGVFEALVVPPDAADGASPRVEGTSAAASTEQGNAADADGQGKSGPSDEGEHIAVGKASTGDATQREPSEREPPVARSHMVSRIDGANPRRGHMQMGTLPAEADARAWVQLRASPTGFVNAAFAVTLLIAGIFFFGLTRLDNIDQADAAAAILLSVPTLLAAYIARPGEHALVSLMLMGVRAMVAVSGFLLFLGAAAIAFGYKVEAGGRDRYLDDIWATLRWPALFLAVGVAWSWAVVHWPDAAPPQARKWGKKAAPYVVLAAVAAVAAAVLDYRDDCTFGPEWRHAAVPTALAVVAAGIIVRRWIKVHRRAVWLRGVELARRSRVVLAAAGFVLLVCLAFDYRDDRSFGAVWDPVRWPAVVTGVLAMASTVSLGRDLVRKRRPSAT